MSTNSTTSGLLIDGKKIKNPTLTDFHFPRHIVHGSTASGDEDISFGFSSYLLLEEWLDKQSPEEQKMYEFLSSMRGLAIRTRPLTPEEEVKEFGLKKITEIESENDTTRSIFDTTLKLYSDNYYQGRHLYLGTGIYPNLGWYDFNNVTNSYKCSAGCFVFFRYPWFKGQDLYHLGPISNPHFVWWANKLSSLIYVSYVQLSYWILCSMV